MCMLHLTVDTAQKEHLLMMSVKARRPDHLRGISQSSSLPRWSPNPPAAHRRPEPTSTSLPLPFDLAWPEDNKRVKSEPH